MTDQPHEPGPADVVTLEIKLRHIICADGRRAWQFESTAGAENIEMLGLLAAGTAEVYTRMNAGRR